MRNKRVLIITYYWPPSGGVGVQRWMHFAVNLKKLGWEPVIYTPSNPQFDIKDESLSNFVKGLEVVKQEIWEPFNFFHRLTRNKNKEDVKQGLVLEKTSKSWKDDLIIWIRGNLFVPDPRKFWVKKSVRFLEQMVKERNIDLMITTGPPHSMHLIGFKLKCRIPALKWVSDFRDPWSDWDVIQKLKTSRTNRSRHQSMERQVLGASDLVLTVSKRLATSLSSKAEGVNVQVLSNGISDERIVSDKANPLNQDRFIVGYFGMLNEIRNPEMLWKQLEALCESNRLFNQKLEIRLGGIVSQSIQERLESSPQLHDKVVFLGYLSHDEVFEEYHKASLLLLLLNKSDNAQWILPMKFFEYLSAGKPILSLGQVDSELGEIFQEYEVGKMYDFEDYDPIGTFILSNFEKNYSPDRKQMSELLDRYSRSRQTDKLSSLLNDLWEK